MARRVHPTLAVLRSLSVVALLPCVLLGATHFHYGSPERSTLGAFTETKPQATIALGNASSFVAIADKYSISQVVTDSAGSSYIAGARVFQAAPNQPAITDVLIAKLDRAGNTLFVVTMSGKGSDAGNAIAVDSVGNIYVAGSTTSNDFPLRGAVQSQPGIASTGFVAKLSPDGSQLIYSTYFGGVKGQSYVRAIVADNAGNAYFAGYTSSPDFPHPAGVTLPLTQDGVPLNSGAFYAKISPKGESLLYSGVFSSTSTSCTLGYSTCFLRARIAGVSSVTVDTSGNLYMAGSTNTSGLQTATGNLVVLGTGPFVAKIDSAGTARALTFVSKSTDPVGGDSLSSFGAMTLDASGNVYVTGSTFDVNFPTSAGTFQPAISGQLFSNGVKAFYSDAFITKFTPDLKEISWATFLGGTNPDAGYAIAVDAKGTVWVLGSTSSSDFPNTNGWNSGSDFLAAFNATGTALTYSARYPIGSISSSLSVDSTGAVHTAGTWGLVSVLSLSPAVPTPQIFLVQNAAGTLATHIAPGEIISLFGPNIGPSQPAVSAPNASGFLPPTLANVQVSINDTPVPLLYVSQNQINAVAPLGLTGNAASVRVSVSGQVSSAFNVPVVGQAPGIFRANTSHAVALNQDGTINSAANPAAAGSVVALWVTGVNALDPTLKDGQIQTRAFVTGCCTVQAAGQAAQLFYSGDAPGTVAGLSQINFQVPPGNAATEAPITVISGKESDTANIYVK